MIDEVVFGTVVKMGKTLVQSWKAGRDHFECTATDNGFIFTDTKKMYGDTVVGKENVKYVILQKKDLETSAHLSELKKRGRKPNGHTE